MKVGKVPENVLKRSVIKEVKVNREKILSGPGVGMDNGIFVPEDGKAVVLSTSPVTGMEAEIGVYALMSVANNIAASGADPLGIMVTVLLPDKTEEDVLRGILREIAKKAKTAGLAILGGHTEIMSAVTMPVLSITGVGTVKKNKAVTAAGAKPGQDIVMTKYAGIEGTVQIVKEKEEELLTRYPAVFLKEARNMMEYYSIVKEASIVREYQISAMHDVSECGIYGALWELAAASKVGLEIDLSKIPMKQHTIEVCEFFDLNPYMLRSQGSLLAVSEEGDRIVEALHKEGIEAAVIGRITDNHDKVVFYGDEKRFLEPPRRDEIYKILDVR